MATRQTAGTRAKDTDRNNTCQVLDTALADGQLSMEEHRTRVATATATTLGDLQSLVDDLQTENAPVQMPNLKKPSPFTGSLDSARWGLRAAVAGVLVLLGIGIGWGLYGNTSSPLSPLGVHVALKVAFTRTFALPQLSQCDGVRARCSASYIGAIQLIERFDRPNDRAGGDSRVGARHLGPPARVTDAWL